MRDPLQKGGYNNRSFHAGAGANGSVGSIGRVVGEARKRNRTTAGTIIKESSASLVKTKFIERCGFCDSSAHGLYICPKAAAKNERNEQGGKQGGSGDRK